jgi:hypothetical protein
MAEKSTKSPFEKESILMRRIHDAQYRLMAKGFGYKPTPQLKYHRKPVL